MADAASREELHERIVALQTRLWRIRNVTKAVREFTEVNTVLRDPIQDVYSAMEGIVDQLDQLYNDMDPELVLQSEVTDG